jgi:hypothetical protein
VAATVKSSVSWVVTLCRCSLTRNKISQLYTVKDAKDRRSTFLPIFGTDTLRFMQHYKFQKVRHESDFAQAGIGIHKVQLKSSANTLYRPQHDRPAACVIVQQYFRHVRLFCAFIHTRKDFGARFEKCWYFSFFTYLKSRKFENVCTCLTHYTDLDIKRP